MPKEKTKVQSQKITQFFMGKTPEKVHVEKAKVNNENVRKKFYDDRASKKNHSRKCNLHECIKTKNSLTEKLKEMKEKKKQLQTAIDICIGVLKKKDERIKILKSATMKLSERDTELIFTKFKNKFNDNELATLRSIDSKISSDSSFILTCIRYLYKNDMNRLNNISVTGRSRIKNNQKVQMSPEKREIIAEIYKERLGSLNINENENIQRQKQVNEHIKRAIFNSCSNKSGLENINAKINSTDQTQ